MINRPEAKARASGSERETGRAIASEIFPLSERQYRPIIPASRSERKVSILNLKLATLGAFCALFFLQFSYLVQAQKNSAFIGLENLLLHARREQKRSKQTCWKL